MKNIKRILGSFGVAVMLLAMCVLSAGCGGGADKLQLTDLETKEYNNAANGATITIPADWQVTDEDDNSTVFSNPDGSISLVLKWELGGMSYFSKEELAGLAADVCGSVLQNPEVYTSLELSLFDVAVKAVCTGTAKNGDADVNAVCDTAIIQYFNDVRYYLVAVTDAGTYAEYEDVFTQIANSFNCSLTEDEVYEKMNARNEALAQQKQAAEEQEQQNPEQFGKSQEETE